MHDLTITEYAPYDAFYVAGPRAAHGHRCLSDTGQVLAIGAPNVDDEPLDPHSM